MYLRKENKMSGAKTGVVPCYEGLIKLGASKETATIIKDMESMAVAFNNGIVTWNPYDAEGWEKALMTAKSVTISLKGLRCIGDPGNDFAAEKSMKNGQDAYGYFEINFPSGAVVSWEQAVFDVKSLGFGDSTNGSPLEFDVKSNGKPEFTPA